MSFWIISPTFDRERASVVKSDDSSLNKQEYARVTKEARRL